MKDWYLLRGVEYSTNFDFFLKNQIFLGSRIKMNVSWNSDKFKEKGYNVDENRTINRQTGKTEVSSITVDVRNVNSCLESFVFGEIYGSTTDTENKQLREIHTKLLKGEFGDGKFID